MHTTAADALAAGVPLLTLPGRAFSSRVAASLLRAAGGGLEHGIVSSLRAYADVAAHLARRGGDRGASLRRLSAAARSEATTAALFTDAVFQGGLDRALSATHEACRAVAPTTPTGVSAGGDEAKPSAKAKAGKRKRRRNEAARRRCAYGAIVVPRRA